MISCEWFTLTLGPPLNLPLGGGGRWLEGEGICGGLVSPSGIVPLVIPEVSEGFFGVETDAWSGPCFDLAGERQGDCVGFVGALSPCGSDLVFGFEL